MMNKPLWLVQTTFNQTITHRCQPKPWPVPNTTPVPGVVHPSTSQPWMLSNIRK